MTKVEWTDSLSIDVGLIDEQHKTLIERLNSVATAVEAHEGEREIGKTLAFLSEYTDYHFTEEEKYMEQTGYPGLDEQKIKHAEFVITLKDLEQDFYEDGSTKQISEAINTLLFTWLTKHIKVLDKQFGHFLKEKGIELAE